MSLATAPGEETDVAPAQKADWHTHSTATMSASLGLLSGDIPSFDLMAVPNDESPRARPLAMEMSEGTFDGTKRVPIGLGYSIVPAAVGLAVAFGCTVLFGLWAVGTFGFTCTSAQTDFGCLECSNENLCTECAANLTIFEDNSGKSCHYPCEESQKQEENKCTRCRNPITCNACASGYKLEEPPLNPKLSRENATCQWQCSDTQKGRSCSRCNTPSVCESCHDGFAIETTATGETTCQFQCTAQQKGVGCSRCNDRDTCTKCTGNLELVDIDGKTECHYPCEEAQKQVDNKCARCSSAKTCNACATGYKLEQPPQNPKFAGDDAACQWQCSTTQTERKCTRCNTPSICDTCAEGYALEVVNATAPLWKSRTTCQFQCTESQRKGGCTRCDTASYCVTCASAGYKYIDDGKGNARCDWQCTVPGTTDIIPEYYSWPGLSGQTVKGKYPQGACNPGKCLAPDSTKCAPDGCRHGYSNRNGKCVANSGELLDFYMYRAVNGEGYKPNGINMASAGGVLSYLTVEVVSSQHVAGHCRRKYDIEKILRFHVKVKTTPMAGRWFSEFVAFDRARCTQGAPSFTMCNDMYFRLGYTVGCNNRPQGKYPHAHWYSLPGTCPLKDFENKDEGDCGTFSPGGNCSEPDGTPFCTYSMTPAGSITLDQLVGICDEPDCQNFKQWCQSGKTEFRCPGSKDKDKKWHPPECSDEGLGTDFWVGWDNETRSAERVQKLEDLFEENFPEMPRRQTPGCYKR